MQRNYRLVSTKSTRRANINDLAFYPVISWTGFLEPGTNSFITGINLNNVKSVTLSNSSFSTVLQHYTLANGSIVVSTPNTVILNETYNLTLNTEFGIAIYSNTISNFITGQSIFTANGSTNWTVPYGVTNVSILLIGGGGRADTVATSGGAGGGGLAYVNNFQVTEGEVYRIYVGASGLASWFGNTTNVLIAANGGANVSGTALGGAGGGYFAGIPNVVGYSGGAGGQGGSGISAGGGGGGAAGYSGSGGNGSWVVNGVPSANGTQGTGGSGGGGGAAYTSASLGYGGGGGGVGIFGQTTGNASIGTAVTSGEAGRGRNGSGGSNNISLSASVGNTTALGGIFGGGGGGGQFSFSPVGGRGAVRIIWGNNRSFSNTNVGNF